MRRYSWVGSSDKPDARPRLPRWSLVTHTSIDEAFIRYTLSLQIRFRSAHEKHEADPLGSNDDACCSTSISLEERINTGQEVSHAPWSSCGYSFDGHLDWCNRQILPTTARPGPGQHLSNRRTYMLRRCCHRTLQPRSYNLLPLLGECPDKIRCILW